MELAIRDIGNSKGVVIPKTMLLRLACKAQPLQRRSSKAATLSCARLKSPFVPAGKLPPPRSPLVAKMPWCWVSLAMPRMKSLYGDFQSGEAW